MLFRTISAFVALCICAPIVRAQTKPTIEERLERLEREMGEMKAQLKAKDEEIARLRSVKPSEQPSLDALHDEPTAPAAAHDHGEHGRFTDTFDSRLAVVVDTLGSVSSRRSNDALNRFDVREVHLDLRAAVHTNADGVLILSFERDVENPVFPGDEPPEGPETDVDIEEGYVFIHDFGVPGLTAKLGRFHLRFGKLNQLHLHEFPTSDPPLVNQAFLAPETLSDAGVSLNYAISKHIELTAELISGEGANSESPTLRGDLSVDSPALNVHALWRGEIATNWNLELGTSWLTGHADADNDNHVNLFGGDVTLTRRDPTGSQFNQMLQAEVIHGIVDQEDGGTQRGWGAYVLTQQQFHRDWFTGVRFDWTQDANNDSAEAWAISPYLTWQVADFLRLRAQYQYRAGDVPSENTFYFQATWNLGGGHPPHAH